MTTDAVPSAETTLPIKNRLLLSLPCPLTLEELVDRSQRLARLLNELDRMEDEHAETRRDMKDQRERLEASVRDVRRVVAAGKEDREIEVEDRMDYEAGHVVRHRTDTGQEVWRRKMSPEERQVPMPVDA